ncbi:hypothetical protein [Streptomyces sp. SAS_275]|uniref:hypothetical protein n=1 Tax=Streptomyces sp. SAS_275 TaxID=3412746 RepID=UPI00403D27B3
MSCTSSVSVLPRPAETGDLPTDASGLRTEQTPDVGSTLATEDSRRAPDEVKAAGLVLARQPEGDGA